jgi:hypothetical protein
MMGMSLAAFKCPAFLLLCLAAAGGCGGEVRGTVSGRVTFQGKLVTAGLVGFQNSELGVHMTAPLGADGTYEVITAQGKGLPLGTYRVFVAPPLPDLPLGAPDPAMKPPDLSQVPVRYMRAETSGIVVEVSRGANRLDIDMQPQE